MQSIRKAADLLKVSEYHLLREAWLNWYGDPATEQDLSWLFAQFMMFGEVPVWANSYAQKLIDDHQAERDVPLSSFCLLNIMPRVGDRHQLSFSLDIVDFDGFDMPFDEEY